MTRSELHRQLACATGEAIREIRRHGFGLLDLSAAPDDDHDPLPPQIVDWEALEAERERINFAPIHRGRSRQIGFLIA